MNTRLCISNTSFIEIAHKIKEDNDPFFNFKAESSIIRPSDPSNDTKPLGVGISNNAIVPSNIQDVVHARVHMGRGGVSKEVIKNLEHNMEIDPYSEKKNYLPTSMRNDPSSLLYTLSMNPQGHSVLVEKKWLVARFNLLSDDNIDDFTRVASQLLCFTKATRQSLSNWVKRNLPPPDCVQIIAQPFINIRTSCGIWAQSGKGTGEIAQWQQQTAVQYNGTHKRWITHYTTWLGAAVLNPLKIHIQPDVKFEGYLRGMSDDMIDRRDWNPQQIDWTTCGSCFVFSCGSTFSRDNARKEANPLSLFGAYDRKYIASNYKGQLAKVTKPLWPSFHFYNSVWRFTDINADTILTNPESYQQMTDSTYQTGIMPICTHKIFSQSTRDVTELYRGTGHLDPHDGPLGDLLNGKVTFRQTKIC